MIRSNLRLKERLCAMVLGLMAFGASAAHAEVNSNWMVNGTNVNSTLKPIVGISGIENNTGALLTKIAGTAVDFLCTGAILIGAAFEPEGKITNGAKVAFTGCITLLGGLSGSPSIPCKPKGGGGSFGMIITNSFKGLMVLHEGQPLTLIEPAVVGGALATIEFGEDCSLPSKVPIFGKLHLKDCKNEGEVELVTHLIEQGPLTKLFVISDTPEHAANIDGSANVAMPGAHVGLKFRALSA